MKRLVIAALMLAPVLAEAQDNTWERIEVETPADQTNPDAKYLAADAVPMVDGMVCFQTTIQAPGKSKEQVYDILLKQLEKMVKEPNQLEFSAVALKDREKGVLGAVFHEWLVFKSAALQLDRTKFNFQLLVDCHEGSADVKMTRISYDYDEERKPQHYKAEEWIADKYAVNKKHTKIYPVSGKFRRKTIDRKDFIFNKFSTLLK